MTDSYKTLVDSIEIKEQIGTHVQKRLSRVTSIRAYGAKRISDSMAALLLILDESSLSKISKWPDSRSFSVDITPAEGDPKKTMVYLQLSDEYYEDYFYVLCEDICSRMEKASDEKKAIEIFHKRLVSWQNFLKKNKLDGLSAEAQTGLFGEMLVLRDLFLEWIDHATTVTAWRGCKKANQDFQFKGKAMEVKTTRAAIPERINIANVEQLDEDGIAPLILTVVHVDANETSGETLPEIIESIRTKLTDDAHEPFEEGLMEVGYLDIHANLYNNERYELKQLLHHEVKEGFPRLRYDDIPPGVLRARYEISIDAAREFLVEDDRVEKIFR